MLTPEPLSLTNALSHPLVRSLVGYVVQSPTRRAAMVAHLAMRRSSGLSVAPFPDDTDAMEVLLREVADVVSDITLIRAHVPCQPPPDTVVVCDG
jgi:hypothetical protein